MDGEMAQISSKFPSPISFTRAVSIRFGGIFGDSRRHVVCHYSRRWYLFTVLFLFCPTKPHDLKSGVIVIDF